MGTSFFFCLESGSPLDDPRPLQNRVFKLIEPVVERAGLELVAVELTSTNGQRVLRVSVDQPGGVGFPALSRLSEALSPVLDVEDPVPGAYSLEVSSPGIERPIQRPEDFDRFVGYRAKIKLDAGEGRRRFAGRLLGRREGAVAIEVDGIEHALPLERITKANLDLSVEEYKALGAPRASTEGAARDQ